MLYTSPYAVMVLPHLGSHCCPLGQSWRAVGWKVQKWMKFQLFWHSAVFFHQVSATLDLGLGTEETLRWRWTRQQQNPNTTATRNDSSPSLQNAPGRRALNISFKALGRISVFLPFPPYEGSLLYSLTKDSKCPFGAISPGYDNTSWKGTTWN